MYKLTLRLFNWKFIVVWFKVYKDLAEKYRVKHQQWNGFTQQSDEIQKSSLNGKELVLQHLIQIQCKWNHWQVDLGLSK
jgi:hypothetical protein